MHAHANHMHVSAIASFGSRPSNELLFRVKRFILFVLGLHHAATASHIGHNLCIELLQETIVCSLLRMPIFIKQQTMRGSGTQLFAQLLLIATR